MALDRIHTNETEWLFYHLWEKPDEGSTPIFSFRIPNTILYNKSYLPRIWYFSSITGSILRKYKLDINDQKILKSFQKHKQDEVSGTIISYINEETNLTIKLHHILKKEIGRFKIEEFITKNDKTNVDIFQEFIRPTDVKNSMLEVTWSVNGCHIEKKTNINHIGNMKVPIESRIKTFDAPEHLTDSKNFVSNMLQAKVNAACFEIKEPIFKVTDKSCDISRMTLYFKIDKKDRIFLLFCGLLKINNYDNKEGNVVFNRHVDKVNRTIGFIVEKDNCTNDILKNYHLDKDPNSPIKKERYRSFIAKAKKGFCPFCITKIQGDAVEITRKTLINLFGLCQNFIEKLDQVEKENIIGNISEIPKPLIYYDPYLSVQTYNKIKENYVWLYGPINLCQECFEHLYKFITPSQEITDSDMMLKLCQMLIIETKASSRSKSQSTNKISAKVYKTQKNEKPARKKINLTDERESLGFNIESSFSTKTKTQNSLASSKYVNFRPNIRINSTDPPFPLKEIQEKINPKTDHSNLENNYDSLNFSRIKRKPLLRDRAKTSSSMSKPNKNSIFPTIGAESNHSKKTATSVSTTAAKIHKIRTKVQEPNLIKKFSNILVLRGNEKNTSTLNYITKTSNLFTKELFNLDLKNIL